MTESEISRAGTGHDGEDKQPVSDLREKGKPPEGCNGSCVSRGKREGVAAVLAGESTDCPAISRDAFDIKLLWPLRVRRVRLPPQWPVVNATVVHIPATAVLLLELRTCAEGREGRMEKGAEERRG